MAEHVQLYDGTYGRFELDARQQVRVETYGEDPPVTRSSPPECPPERSEF
jgi:hypothetical protein